jgi:hypothetical protein
MDPLRSLRACPRMEDGGWRKEDVTTVATAKASLDMGNCNALGWERGSSPSFSTYMIRIIGAR